MSKNSLQSLALQSGIARRGRLFTREGKAELNAAVLSPTMEWQRAHWWQLLKPLNQQVLEAMTWLKAASQTMFRLRGSVAGSRVLRYLRSKQPTSPSERRRPKAFLSTSGAPPRPAKGQSSSRQRTSHPRLHHDAR
jgi:hypothetical protein